MEKETKLKFNPFYVSILSLFTILLLYSCFRHITTPLVSPENVARCLLAVVLSFLFFPLTLKMMFNVPAIVLTNDCLKNNLGGYSIEWADIAEIQLYDGVLKSLGKLSINLKDPDKYFNSPIKKIIYNGKQLFVVNDISISIDFVAGNNEEIFQVIKSYWTKNHKH